MRVTIKNIAEKVGVSHATVSRALRDHPLVADKTTKHIKQIADDLKDAGYPEQTPKPQTKSTSVTRVIKKPKSKKKK